MRVAPQAARVYGGAADCYTYNELKTFRMVTMRRKKTLRVLALVLALLVSAGAVIGLLAIIRKSSPGFSVAVGDWPMEGQNPSQTSYLETAPLAPLQEAWNVRLQQTLKSAPAVAGGRLFIGGAEGTLYCLQADNGLPLWEFDAGSEIASTPCVTDDSIFLGTAEGRVYALDIKGRELWRKELGGGVMASPIAAEGRVYVGSFDKSLYCLEGDTGRTVWKFQTGGEMGLSVCVGDGHVFCLSWDGSIYALKQATGELDWSSSTTDHFVASPTTEAGRVFVVSDKALYCLDTQTGREVWKEEPEASYRSNVSLRGNIAVVALGNMYPEGNMELGAYNIKTGDLVWQAGIGDIDQTRQASSNRYVYTATLDGINAYSIEDGSLSLAQEQDGILPYTLTVTSDAIYVATENFKVYCYRQR